MATTDNDRAELMKRIGAAHKMSIHKVAHHMGLAKAAHAKGMSSLKKCAGAMVGANKVTKDVTAFKKGMDEAAGHLSDAHDHFNTAAEHMDDATAHLGSAMSAWGGDVNVSPSTDVGGKITIPGLTELTEGSVPWYDSAEPYGEKVALTKLLAGGEVLSKAAAEKMVADAVATATAKATSDALTKQVETLSKQVELLQRMPAGAPKVKIFDFEKSPLPGMVGNGDTADTNRNRLGALMDGVDLDMKNEHDFTAAGGRMIANMIKGGPKFGGDLFGKAPMWDPAFHGRGGTGARN